MASRAQRIKRYAFWCEFAVALALIAGFAGCSSLSDQLTAVQPVGFSQSR